MLRFVSVFLFLLASVALTLPAQPPVSQLPLADPYVLTDGGLYYAYGTGSADGILVYTSRDLSTWYCAGHALHKSNTSESVWFWAPEVYKRGNLYYMYYSANEHLYVATSSSPLGPFVQVGSYMMEKLIGLEKCIDSSVYFDNDGTPWCFFVRFTDGNCIWRCQLADDAITPVEGTLSLCFASTAPWELALGRVVEGPNVVKHGDTYFLTYSANDYRSQDYGVGYATASSLAGRLTKYARNPIMQRVENLVGTGHHSLFYDYDGNLRIAFHAHKSATEVHGRRCYFGTMRFDGNALVMTDDPIVRPVLTNEPILPD